MIFEIVYGCFTKAFNFHFGIGIYYQMILVPHSSTTNTIFFTTLFSSMRQYMIHSWYATLSRGIKTLGSRPYNPQKYTLSSKTNFWVRKKKYFELFWFHSKICEIFWGDQPWWPYLGLTILGFTHCGMNAWGLYIERRPQVLP